ncbi:MAG: hypothetical protein ACYC9O_18465, partial [Candidatus Latescibacterota bacterium]
MIPLLFLQFISVAQSQPSLRTFAQVDTTALDFGSYPVAYPLKGGPVRVLFLGARESTGYSCREIASRLDCELETVLTESRDRLGMAVPPAGPDSAFFAEAGVAALMIEQLDRKWDAVWLDYSFPSLPEPVKNSLRKLLGEGCGLVYTGENRDLRPLSRGGKFDRTFLRGIGYPGGETTFAGYCGVGAMLALPGPGPESDAMQMGDYHALAVHALLLVSGRMRGFALTGLENSRKTVEHESIGVMSYRVYFQNSGKTVPMTVQARYRNENGAIAAQSEEVYALQKGKGYFRVRYPVLPVGKYSVDISVLEEGKAVAFGGTSFTVESLDGLRSLELRSRLADADGYVMGRIRTSREIQEGMVLSVDLVDAWGRRLDTVELNPAARQLGADFVLKAKARASGVLSVRAGLFKNNVLIHLLEERVIGRADDKSRMFPLVVLDCGGIDFRKRPGFEKLADEGVSWFAFDLTGLTPEEAFRTVLHAPVGRTEFVPAFSVNGASDETLFRRELQGIVSAVDTLRHAGVPAYILRMNSPLRPSPRNDRAIERIAEAIAARDSTARVMVMEPDREGGFPHGGAYRLSAPGFGANATGPNPPEGERDGNDVLRRSPRAGQSVWRTLLQGGSGVCWVGVSGTPGSALTPGFGVNADFAGLAGEYREIGEGVGALISGSKNLSSSDAILGNLPDSVMTTGERRGGGEFFLFENGAFSFIGFLPDGDVRSEKESFSLDREYFGNRLHLYDVWKGQYLGMLSGAARMLSASRNGIYGLLPYRVRSLDIGFHAPVI